MTDKHWFIYRGDHHLGPFTFQEILDKVKLSQIEEDELTWCEGNSDWLPIKDQPAIQNALFSEQRLVQEKQRKEQSAREALEAKKQAEVIRQQAEQERQKKHEHERLEKERREREKLEKQRQEKEQEIERQRELERQKRQALKKEQESLQGEEPPPLPPLPPEAYEEEAQEAQDDVFVEENFIEDFVAPDEYEDTHEDSYESESEYEDQDEFEADQEVTCEVDQEALQEKVTGARLYSAIALCLLGVGLFIYLISQTFTGQRRLYNVAGRDKDALYNVMNRPYKGVPIHRMRATKDLNSLWLATNFPDQAILYMSLESVPGRTLTPSEESSVVEVQSVAYLKGGAALFEQLEVLKGETLHIGEYRYVIRGTRVGLKGKLSAALGDKALFKDMKFIKSKNQQFELKGTLLLSPYGEDKFEEKLKEHLVFIDKSVVRPLKDRLQRYVTFMGLLERMDNLYKDTMKKITKGRSIQLFEDRYNEEVGPFLRDLIIDNNRLYLSLRNLQPKDSRAYEELMNFGKDIGIIASEMVTKTRKVNRLTKTKSAALLKHFKEKLDKLRQQGQLEKSRIKNRLAPFVDTK